MLFNSLAARVLFRAARNPRAVDLHLAVPSLARPSRASNVFLLSCVRRLGHSVDVWGALGLRGIEEPRSAGGASRKDRCVTLPPEEQTSVSQRVFVPTLSRAFSHSLRQAQHTRHSGTYIFRQPPERQCLHLWGIYVRDKLPKRRTCLGTMARSSSEDSLHESRKRRQRCRFGPDITAERVRQVSIESFDGA